MPTRTKWALAITSLIVLLLIAAPIFFYVKDFYNLPRSEVPSDWGTFGDYFGGILNPVISLLTLIVTIAIAISISKIEQRNHDEAVHSPVKPLLTIEIGEFYSSDISRIGLSVERDFYSYDRPQQPAGPDDYLGKQFYLKVTNKGLGIATDINVTFEVNLEELTALLVIDNQKLKVVAGKVATGDDGRKTIALQIQSTPYNYHGFLYRVWEKETQGLGIAERDKEIKVPIPSQIIGTFQLYNLIRRMKNIEGTFPTLFAKFNYKNIHGKSLGAKFRIGLLHRHDYAHYSIFRIVYEQM